MVSPCLRSLSLCFWLFSKVIICKGSLEDRQTITTLLACFNETLKRRKDNFLGNKTDHSFFSSTASDLKRQ